MAPVYIACIQMSSSQGELPNDTQPPEQSSRTVIPAQSPSRSHEQQDNIPRDYHPSPHPVQTQPVSRPASPPACTTLALPHQRRPDTLSHSVSQSRTHARASPDPSHRRTRKHSNPRLPRHDWPIPPSAPRMRAGQLARLAARHARDERAVKRG